MWLYPTKPFQYATRPAFFSAAFGPLKYSSIAAVTGSTEEGISLVATFSNAVGEAPLSSNCLSTNTIFTLMESGVGVNVAVEDGVRVGVLLAVNVGKAVADGVGDFVAAGVLVNVDVDVNAGTFVGVLDGVKVGLLEGVTVEVLLGVSASSREGSAVGVEVGVNV
jgi:hypothetical protein